MKKRHIVFALTALVLLITSIVPVLSLRISYEHSHRGYVTAIELNDTAAQFEHKGAFYSELLRYKASGVTTAVLREHKDGSLDTQWLEVAALAGLDTAICSTSGAPKGLTYEKNLRAAIEKYNVKYLLIKAAETQDAEAPLTHFIEDYDLTLVLCENPNQLSNESPLGFDSYVAAANGRIMRCYETQKNPMKFLTSGSYDPDLIYHHMMNSARDRNTEFLLINQLTDAADTPQENAKVTQDAIAKFCAWMQRAGYTPGFAGSLAGYSPNLRSVHAAGAALGILMLMPMLFILRKKSTGRTEWILFALAALAYGISWVMPFNLLLLYPSLFAPLGACFSFTLCYAFAQKTREKLHSIVHTCAVLALGFVLLLSCCCVLSAMLSGMENYLNIYIFRGVSLTLLLPIVYAIVLMYSQAEQKAFRISALKENWLRFKSRLRPWHILIVLAVLAVLAIYILRSGNMKISGLENRIRNLISEVSLARPRTKEFLIGWPALAIFAYYIHSDKSKLLTWAFAAGSSILFASVMNTFCHVFTDMTTSVLRTVNGLVFSVPFILIFALANMILVRFLFKSKLDTKKDV